MGAAASFFPAYSEADWRKAAGVALKGASIESLATETADGARIEPVYPPADGPRAVLPGGPWRIITRLDHASGAEANVQALDDLANGANGLRIVFSGALGAYGFGLKRFDSASLHKAFDGVRFDTGANFELDLGPDGPDQAVRFGALVERSGVKPEDCAVSFGLDPFARLARAPLPADPRAQATAHVEAALELKSKGFPGPLLAADARAVHAAGGTSAQELAFALAGAVGSLRWLEAAGTAPAKARALIAFRLAADADELTTLSKFRALRILWSRVEEACGLEPRPARVEAESAWRMMTARDVHVNVMRGAAAAFAAGLGGADTVSVLPHTLAVGLPDGFARRIARNAQLILLRESNLGFVADPAAGAGAFEAMTRTLCEKAWGLFQEIEAEGGLSSTLASGAFRRRVAVSAAALARNVAQLKTPITGVSVHADLAERPTEVALGAPEREAFAAGEGGFTPIRLAEPFERLRDCSDAFLERTGERPKVYLAALGADAKHRRRVAFVREWLEAGGFEAIYDGEAPTAEEALKRLTASGAPLVCLCGTDEAYAAEAKAFAQAFRTSDVKGVALAGRPGELEDAWRAVGVDTFIFEGEDAILTLQGLYRCIGVDCSRAR